ncbi:SET domain-containing protein [Pseudoruegeria sp. HB172150]|uniref:SET domain-containing protein n=1 Tax=Pseudoruegeria sp. HB172150 TaxID=2721164 RepID=UPI0015575655|nr:SET domain-containing protein-lysine N-methyltransferase [Pseudoruegeria sp. HB172150]
MMMVRCYLAPSRIEGLGVFAHTDIRKGGLVWLYDPRFDVSYEREDIERAPKHFREFLERYTYEHPGDPDRVVLDCDEGLFMNHADVPNLDLSNPSRGVATRLIPAGEELTCHYGQFTVGRVEFQPPRHRVSPVHLAAE